MQQLGEATEGDAWVDALIEYATDLGDPFNVAQLAYVKFPNVGQIIVTIKGKNNYTVSPG